MIDSLREPLADLKAVENDPMSIKDIANQTEDLQLLAVNNDPDSIQFIKHPFPSVQKAAVELDPHTIRHFYKIASPEIRMCALQVDPEIIKYLTDSTKEEQHFVIDEYISGRCKDYSGLIPNQIQDIGAYFLKHMFRLQYLFPDKE